MNDGPFAVPVGESATSADDHPALGRPRRALLLLGPSAGGHRRDAGTLRLVEVLSPAGLEIIAFNFLYRERELRRPDPMASLQRCYRAVVDWAVDRFDGALPLLLGGRSMGGRVASMLAADGLPCRGLVLFAYPLHPAGEPDRLRSAHLPDIPVPTLCFNGTRDRLCRRDLMETAVGPLRDRWTMHWLAEADHSFGVSSSSGRSASDVLAEVGAATNAWLDSLRLGESGGPSAPLGVTGDER